MASTDKKAADKKSLEKKISAKKSDDKKKVPEKKNAKKEAKSQIALLMEHALESIKHLVDEKKFKEGIKKAAKLFHQHTEPKKTANKAAPKKKASVILKTAKKK